jgi:hypothetical protein
MSFCRWSIKCQNKCFIGKPLVCLALFPKSFYTDRMKFQTKIFTRPGALMALPMFSLLAATSASLNRFLGTVIAGSAVDNLMRSRMD